jgi:16S rRNA (cytosine1402-N4)-methyltransferase
MAHIPVLLNEILAGLDPKEGEIFLDGTVNRGGHAKAIGEKLGQTGLLIGLDRDAQALTEAKENLKDLPCQVSLILGNFRDLGDILDAKGIKAIDGALFDFGLSSQQLDDSGRGFTFRHDEPLLMTFEAESGENDLTAAKIVNEWEESVLADILFTYAEERYSRQIAKGIVDARRRAHILTTGQLVAVIEAAVPAGYKRGKINCATKTFQALRIAVNDELGAIKEGVRSAWEILKPGGRLAVISFHSLEAGIVKEFFNAKKKERTGEIILKAAKPSYLEVRANPRSRSAQLRIIKKI